MTQTPTEQEPPARSSRFQHLLDCTNEVLWADPDEVAAVLTRWASGGTAGSTVTVNTLTRSLAALVDYLNDDGFDALISLAGVKGEADERARTDLSSEVALIGAAAGLTGAEILDTPETGDMVDRLRTMAALRGHRVV
jgi:hypothetical protein